MDNFIKRIQACILALISMGFNRPSETPSELVQDVQVATHAISHGLVEETTGKLSKETSEEIDQALVSLEVAVDEYKTAHPELVKQAVVAGDDLDDSDLD